MTRHADGERSPAAAGTVAVAVLVAALSAVVPGAGQLAAGRRRRSVPFLAFTVLSLAAAVAALLAGRERLLELVVQPGWLTAFIVVAGLSLVVRLVAAADAYGCVRPWFGRPVLPTAAGLVLLALVAGLLVVPHVALTRVALAQRDLVTDVFADEPVAPVEPGPLPSATVTTPGPSARPTAKPSPSASTAKITNATLGRDGRFTVLLLGSDAGPYRSGARTDTMVLVSIDPATRSAVMIGVPRNLAHVPFPPGPMQRQFPEGFDNIANAVYGYGTSHPSMFGHVKDPGATAVEQAVSAATGLEIDDWAMVDLDGVVGVVAALGGVTLDVPVEIKERVSPYVVGGPWISADIRPGRQHLTADEVYVYIRARHLDSDYQRMGRQRCVLAAIGDRLTGPRLITSYPSLAAVISRNVSTDIPRSRLPQLVRMGSRLSPSRVRALLLVPPLVDPRAPDYTLIRTLVRNALRGHLPASSAAATSLVAACD